MIISESAQEEIDKSGKFLVILVDIGGCKGFFFDFFYTETEGSYFKLAEKVLTDEYSLPFLEEGTLDFESEIGFQDFLFTTPETTYCGCKKSFKL